MSRRWRGSTETREKRRRCVSCVSMLCFGYFVSSTSKSLIVFADGKVAVLVVDVEVCGRMDGWLLLYHVVDIAVNRCPSFWC